jgi:hypothetical protein
MPASVSMQLTSARCQRSPSTTPGSSTPFPAVLALFTKMSPRVGVHPAPRRSSAVRRQLQCAPPRAMGQRKSAWTSRGPGCVGRSKATHTLQSVRTDVGCSVAGSLESRAQRPPIHPSPPSLPCCPPVYVPSPFPPPLCTSRPARPVGQEERVRSPEWGGLVGAAAILQGENRTRAWGHAWQRAGAGTRQRRRARAAGVHRARTPGGCSTFV